MIRAFIEPFKPRLSKVEGERQRKGLRRRFRSRPKQTGRCHGSARLHRCCLFCLSATVHVSNPASFVLLGQCGSNKDAANQQLCRCNQSSSEPKRPQTGHRSPSFQCDTGTMCRSPETCLHWCWSSTPLTGMEPIHCVTL